MSDTRLDKGLGKTSLALVWNKMKAYVNSFMGTVDAKLKAYKDASAYSLEEVKTNETWIDGKPIYRKTVYIPSFPSAAGNQSYAHNTDNLDSIVNMEGMAYAKSSTMGTSQVLNYAITASSTVYMVMQATKTNIIIYVGQDRSTWEAYITLYYTKTTD
ncbi:MAG: hypothetical protein ACI4TD_11865 [Phocaeicola sp.]